MPSKLLTIEIPQEEEEYFELACKKLGVSLEEFFVLAGLEKLENLEDELLGEQTSLKKNRQFLGRN